MTPLAPAPSPVAEMGPSAGRDAPEVPAVPSMKGVHEIVAPPAQGDQVRQSLLAETFVGAVVDVERQGALAADPALALEQTRLKEHRPFGAPPRRVDIGGVFHEAIFP